MCSTCCRQHSSSWRSWEGQPTLRPKLVQAGMLRCRLNPSIGFVIFGHQSMECGFQPVSGPVQAYEGAINTVGIDLGVSEGGRLAWITTACCPPERILTQQWQGEWPGVGTSQNVSSS